MYVDLAFVKKIAMMFEMPNTPAMFRLKRDSVKKCKFIQFGDLICQICSCPFDI